MSQPTRYASSAERQAAYRQRRALCEASRAREAGIVPLPAIPSIPGTARWRQALAHAAFHAETVRDEMQAYHDSRTERWQESQRAEEFQERLALVELIVEQLEEVSGQF